MDKETKQRLKWVELYESTQDPGLVCRRCGISRPTLRKWWLRYPVRVNLMPIVPVPEWRGMYEDFLKRLLNAVPVSRLTMGGICIYPDARALMERKLGRDNLISEALDPAVGRGGDRRQRFSPDARVEVYRFLVDLINELSPETEVALCLETVDVMDEVGLLSSRGRCNCVL